MGVRAGLFEEDGFPWAEDWAPLRVDVRRFADRVELIANGDLDSSTSGQLLDELVACIGPSCRQVTVDLAGVEFADLAGIDGLARCRDEVERRSCRFTVARPSRSVQLLFDLTNSGSLFAREP